MQVGEIEPPDCGRREPVTHIRRYWRALRRGMWNEPHLDFRQLELKAVGVAGRLFCSALQYCFNEVQQGLIAGSVWWPCASIVCDLSSALE
jgi:hypothetical protein